MSCDLIPIVDGKPSQKFQEYANTFSREEAIREFERDPDFTNVFATDGVMFSPVVNDENRIDRAKEFVKRNKRDQISVYRKRKFQLEQNYKDTDNEKDRITLRRFIRGFENRIKEIENNIKEVDNYNTIDFMITEASQDIDKLEKYLDADDISTSYQRLIQEMIDFWLPVVRRESDQFLTEEEQEFYSDILDDLQNRFAWANRQITRFNEKTTKEFVESETGRKTTIEKMKAALNDAGFFKKMFLDLGAVDNPIVQAIFTSIKKANKRTRVQANEVFEEIQELTDQMLKKGTFELFLQEDENGLTGKVVNRFSPTFFQKRAENKKNKMWRRNNEILLDMNRLVEDSDDSIPEEFRENASFDPEYVEELRQHLGEGTEKYIEIVQKKYDEYIQDRKRVYEEYSLAKFKEWTNNNSPFQAAQEWNRKSESVFFSNYNSLTWIPKRYFEDGSETGYYDDKYDVIQADADLRAYHDKLTSSLRKFNYMLPHYMRTQSPGYDIPFIKDAFFSSFKGVGAKISASDHHDLIKYLMAEGNEPTEMGADIDYQTGKKKRRFNFHGSTSVNSMIEKKTEQALKDEAFKQDVKVSELDSDVVREITLEIRNAITGDMSKDLTRAMKTLAMGGLMHQNKHMIEDHIMIAQSQFKDVKKLNINRQGAIMKALGRENNVETPESIQEMLDYYIDSAFYGLPRKISEGSFGKKVYGKRDKEELAKVEELIEVNNRQFEEGKIQKKLYEENKVKLDSRKEQIGATKTFSQIGDTLLKWFQMKVMGWNYAAGAANLGFGVLGNFTMIDERLYTREHLEKAYWEMSKHPKKRQALSKKFDVLKKTSEELFAKSDKKDIFTPFRKMKLGPYDPMDSTERWNQDPILIAFLLNEKITDKEGNESNLWDAYDHTGTIKPQFRTDENIDDYVSFKPNNRIDRLRITIDEQIARIHGNYDPDKPLLVKQKFVWRAFSQFRTWAFEGFRARWADEQFNEALGIETKGRWNTGIGIFTAAVKDENGEVITIDGRDMNGIRMSIFQANQFLLSLITRRNPTLAKLTGNAGQKREARYDKLRNAGVKEVDIQNMKQNLREMFLYIGFTMATMLLSAGEDEDDDELSGVRNFLFNQGLRIRSDILFYMSPDALMRIANEPFGLFSLYSDIGRWVSDINDTTFGDKESTLQAGPNKGWNRNVRNTIELLPLSTQWMKIHRLGYDQLDD